MCLREEIAFCLTFDLQLFKVCLSFELIGI
jgi:hypothetical protein